MSWSPQQEMALKSVSEWLASRDVTARRWHAAPQVFRLFGYAGTGKTTLAKQIAEDVGGEVAFACFTGKAALVLRNKGCTDATTIHSLIYQVQEDVGGAPKFVLNDDSALKTADLVIIDECSMVDEKIGHDLMSFGVPILVLGDPAQLPPVKGAGFFTEHEPDIMLDEIHRQAADNPIVRMAQTVREGGRLDFGSYGSSRVIRYADVDRGEVLEADTILVGKNATRRGYNARIRKLLGRQFANIPEAGDRLVCLRNNHNKGLLNGGIWNAIEVANGDGRRLKVNPTGPSFAKKRTPAAKPVEEAARFSIIVGPEDGRGRNVEVAVPRQFFEGTENSLDWQERRRSDEFDFGYALTVHKSQGSPWGNVMVFAESAVFGEDRHRHLYTAITRAAERVTVVSGG